MKKRHITIRPAIRATLPWTASLSWCWRRVRVVAAVTCHRRPPLFPGKASFGFTFGFARNGNLKIQLRLQRTGQRPDPARRSASMGPSIRSTRCWNPRSASARSRLPAATS